MALEILLLCVLWWKKPDNGQAEQLLMSTPKAYVQTAVCSSSISGRGTYWKQFWSEVREDGRRNFRSTEGSIASSSFNTDAAEAAVHTSCLAISCKLYISASAFTDKAAGSEIYGY